MVCSNGTSSNIAFQWSLYMLNYFFKQLLLFLSNANLVSIFLPLIISVNICITFCCGVSKSVFSMWSTKKYHTNIITVPENLIGSTLIFGSLCTEYLQILWISSSWDVTVLVEDLLVLWIHITTMVRFTIYLCMWYEIECICSMISKLLFDCK